MNLWFTALDGLVISALGGYNFTLNESRHYRASQKLSEDLSLPLATLDQYKNNVEYRTMQFLGEYTKKIDKHAFKALLGYSFENQRNEERCSLFRDESH